MAPSHPEHVDAVAVLIMADVGRKAITQVKQAASEIGGFDRSVQVYKTRDRGGSFLKSAGPSASAEPLRPPDC
jgi:hypothetical protein